MGQLPKEALEHVAEYFRALADPTRLQILNALRGGEHNVGELAALCNCSSANVSRHLATLSAHGLVARTARGTSAYYRIADQSVDALCELVCGSIARRLEQAALSRQPFLLLAGDGAIFNNEGEKQ
jgi:DNA-binding transcriptional ArsR family regulator